MAAGINPEILSSLQSYESPTNMTSLHFTPEKTSSIAANASTYDESTWSPAVVMLNGTLETEFPEMGAGDEEREYIFDRLSVRAVFILLYTIVFCFCFFGNLMVILVVTLHWRMRNITKFCLANLAFADLCVGVFCVYQNLSTYLINSWVLGEFLCKMYQFINALSHTASILILVVMCVERHLAILHPFRCKQLLTMRRLRIIIITVWVISAIYCSPKLYYIVTLRVYRMDGGIEIICTAKRTLYDSRTFDMIHFFLLFLLPLFVITILYTRVGITLWQTSKNRLPWTTANFTTTPISPTIESTLSRSSSETVNDESPTTSTSRSLNVAPKTGNSPGNCRSSPSRNKFIKRLRHLFQRKKMACVEQSSQDKSPSFVVTIENKCHLVGPRDTKVVEIVPEVVVCENERMRDSSAVTDGLGQSRLQLKPTYFPPEVAAALAGSERGRSSNSPLQRQGSFHQDGFSSVKKKKLASSCSSATSAGSSHGKRLSTAKNLRGGREALKSRQTVVRMLIVIVVTFAMCNLPFHLRKMFQYWWPNYDYVSVYSTLATPLTHLIMYANCAINPIIYAFMSKTFRSSFKELLCCRWKKSFTSANQREQSVCGGAPMRLIRDDCQD